MSDNLPDPASMVPGADAPQAPEPKGGEADKLAAAREAFDKLLKEQQADEAPEPEPEAKPAKKPSKGSQKAAKAPEPEEAPEEAAEPPPKKDPEVERLRRKLLLAGNPKHIIESSSDQEVRDWWEVLEERERSTATALQQASEARKELDRLKATSKQEPQGVPTGDEDLEDIASELADQFGEDEAGAMLKALKSLTEPLRQQVQQFQEMFGEARKRTADQIASGNRQRLAAKLPAIAKNDGAWGILRQNAEQAMRDAKPGDFGSFDEAYDKVFGDLYGDVLEAQRQESLEDEKAAISASGVTPPASKPKAKPATPEEAAYAAYKHLINDPEDSDGARRAARRALRA